MTTDVTAAEQRVWEAIRKRTRPVQTRFRKLSEVEKSEGALRRQLWTQGVTDALRAYGAEQIAAGPSLGRAGGEEVSGLEQLTAAMKADAALLRVIAERDEARRQADTLASALRETIGFVESYIHDEYDGTRQLEERLGELNQLRGILDEYDKGAQ